MSPLVNVAPEEFIKVREQVYYLETDASEGVWIWSSLFFVFRNVYDVTPSCLDRKMGFFLQNVILLLFFSLKLSLMFCDMFGF